MTVLSSTKTEDHDIYSGGPQYDIYIVHYVCKKSRDDN